MMTVSKRGSAAVLLMTILASILLLVIFFIHAASQAAGRSYTDAVLDLAGRSVLSEYDRQLQKRYGIFAFHSDETQAEEKIRCYADYSFHDNVLKEALRGRTYTDTLRLDLESVHVNLKGYSVIDIDLFENQIMEYMKYAVIRNNCNQSDPKPLKQEGIVLRNEQIINSLPSKGYQSNFFRDLESIVKNGLPNLDDIKTTTAKTYLTDEYIISRFLNHSRGHENRQTFFLNEVEYILKGGYDDLNNYKDVRRDLFILRNVMNLLHINNNSEKRRIVESIAAALTLAEGKEIGSIVVAEAWAAAETENDLRLLEDGNQVALFKREENWAVPVSDTLEYLWKKDYVKPEMISGYDYEDYLRILLYLEGREKKLLRCMDLIQLNMKGSYYKEFDLREYYCGFQFSAVVKERTYAYLEMY